MFRCITELKGLIVDIDSFGYISASYWKEIVKHYQCLFLTSSIECAESLREKYNENKVYEIEPFRKLFAPSENTHREALSRLKLKTSEVAYVSANISFLQQAMGFLCGSIWIANKIDYKNASVAPDLICYDLNELMNQLHPYSTAIYLNKREGKSYYRKYDDVFSKLFVSVVDGIQKKTKIDGICAVPPRPGKHENRFDFILSVIAGECNIENFNKNFSCVVDYPTQKNLNQLERQMNVEDVFRYEGNLQGKNIVIIDDIISTGATISSCIRELKKHGVNQVFVVVLAVNQLEGNYWSSEVAQVDCPDCGSRMRLLINGREKKFFYSCMRCNKTLNFFEGWKRLCYRVNSEFN